MQSYALTHMQPSSNPTPPRASISSNSNPAKKIQKVDIFLAVKGCAVGTVLFASGYFCFLQQAQQNMRFPLFEGSLPKNTKKTSLDKKVEQKTLSENYLKIWKLAINTTEQTVHFTAKHKLKVPFLSDKERCSDIQKNLIRKSSTISNNSELVCLHVKQSEKRKQKEGPYVPSSLDWVLGRVIERSAKKTNKLYELNPGTIDKNNQMVKKNSEFKVDSCEILKSKLLTVNGLYERIKPLLYGKEYCLKNQKEILYFHNKEKQNYHIARILNTTAEGVWVTEKFSTLLPQENFIASENLSNRYTKMYLASVDDSSTVQNLEVFQRTDKLCGTLCIDPSVWRVN
ncbi:MAG: hypothetical protein V4629_02040 [Pseudomonadota bacterium]